jgi:hypothetical protein
VPKHVLGALCTAQVRREVEAEVGPCCVAIPPLPSFDGNVITPGTAFMARLSAHLEAFFRQKLGADPDWQHLLVCVGVCVWGVIGHCSLHALACRVCA